MSDSLAESVAQDFHHVLNNSLENFGWCNVGCMAMERAEKERLRKQLSSFTSFLSRYTYASQIKRLVIKPS
jgi:hypothetical protein